MQKVFEVSTLSPAYVANGIVMTAELVLRVVPAGPVRTRDAQIELFCIHLLAGETKPDIANNRNASLWTTEIEGEVHGLVTLGGRAHDHAVESFSLGQLFNTADAVDAVERQCVGAFDFSELLGALGAQVHTEHFVAHRRQQSTTQLADEPEPDHTDSFSRSQIEASDTLERDTPESTESSFSEGHLVRNPDNEIFRDGDILRMARKPRAHAGHAV